MDLEYSVYRMERSMVTSLSCFTLLLGSFFSFLFCLRALDGIYVSNKKHGSGWWRFTNGKVRPGEWKDDVLVRWTGPEQFEVQMKAKRIKPKL